MKERTTKVKQWFKDHSDDILVAGAMFVGCTVAAFGGYFIGKKFTEYGMALGMEDLHHKGVLKFVNPKTGLDIDVKDVIEVANSIE